MYENGIEPNAYTFAELIQLLGDCGKWELVLSHYYEMTSSKSERESPSRRLRAPTANAHVFSATMNALCQSNKHDECREVWGKMISQGIEPTAITLVSLLKILERKHDGRRALEYFRLVQNRNEAEINIVVYNVVLSALSKSECAGEAKEIFEEILESRRVRPDRVTYETMVAAYAHVGDYRRADEFFRRMKFASYQPSDYAYVGRIKAYAKNDMWRECVSILKEVEQEDGVQVRARAAECWQNSITSSFQEKESKADSLSLSLSVVLDDLAPALGARVQRGAAGMLRDEEVGARAEALRADGGEEDRAQRLDEGPALQNLQRGHRDVRGSAEAGSHSLRHRCRCGSPRHPDGSLLKPFLCFLKI